MRILQLLPCIHHIARASLRSIRTRPTKPLIRRTYVTADSVTQPKGRLHEEVIRSVLNPNNAPLQLRDYQEECIEAVLTKVEDGEHRMAISLATGSGKTVIFTQLISRLTHPHEPERASQTLVLAHRTELVQQAYEQCRQAYPDLLIEIEMAGQNATGVADITIASVQSICSGERIMKFDPKRFKLILIDECHHAVAPRYLKILDHFGVKDMTQGERKDKPLVVGVSATMSRFDGLGLNKVLDYVVYHKDFIDMMNDKWLSPITITTVRTNADLKTVGISKNDFISTDLSIAVNTDEINEITVRTWMDRCQEVRKSTIVFCVDIAHVCAIVDKFRDYGIDAHAITGNTPTQVRKTRLDGFKSGDFDILVNCGVFTEGTDIPNIDCVLLARPTRSRNLLVQMIGRGMRLYPGKENCHVIDMVASVDKGLITVPTLLGLDPDEILNEKSIEAIRTETTQQEILELNDLEQEAPAVVESPRTQTPTVVYTEYESIFDLLGDKRQDKSIHTLSKLSWVCVSHVPQKFILSVGKQGYLTLYEKEDLTFSASETQKMPPELRKQGKFFKSKPRLIVEGAISLENAVHAADTYLTNKYPQILLTRHATWRKWPATPQQIRVLEKIKSAGEFDSTGLTKGQAGDMITRLIHGGVGRWTSIQADKKKIYKQRAKEQELRQRELRQRESVQVGKL